MSQTEYVLKIIQDFGDEMTYDDLESLTEGLSRDQLRFAVNRLFKTNEVIPGAERGRFRAASQNARASQGKHIQLPTIAKNREGKRASIYTSPTEATGVVQMFFCYTEIGWKKVALSGDHLMICVGPDIPSWDMWQETDTGIQAVRLVLRDGDPLEIPVDNRNPVTWYFKED